MIIGLMGYAQTGKDTAAKLLVENYGFTRLAFADVLRDCAYALNPTIVRWHGPEQYSENAEITDVQTQVDRIGWDRAKVEYDEVRVLLQRLGTEAGRNILGQNIWVDAAMRKIEPHTDYVFTDVRFPNEAAAIVGRGGILWRVKRKGFKPVNAHPSETAVDHIEAHYTINNDGTIKDLHALVRNGQAVALEQEES